MVNKFRYFAISLLRYFATSLLFPRLASRFYSPIHQIITGIDHLIFHIMVVLILISQKVRNIHITRIWKFSFGFEYGGSL
jgi:hypothetical protein